MSGFQVGDVVVAVHANKSLCGYHTVEAFGGDPHPEMIGTIYRVTALSPRYIPGCCGGFYLDGVPDAFCTGCFRKVQKADEQFIVSLRACKPQRVGEPA